MRYSALLDVGRRCDQIGYLELLHQESQGKVNEFGRHRVEHAKGRGRDHYGDTSTASRDCLGMRRKVWVWRWENL